MLAVSLNFIISVCWIFQLGGLAGNLMMKWHHRDFPSDVFIILETLQALLCIGKCYVVFYFTLSNEIGRGNTGFTLLFQQHALRIMIDLLCASHPINVSVKN